MALCSEIDSVKLLYALGAQAVVLLHFLWIVFVITGAFFLKRHPKLRLAHLAAVVYSVAIEIFVWVCPLTPLEKLLWRKAGREAYQGSFLIHYLETLIYLQAPQWLLALLAVALLGVTLYLDFWSPASSRPFSAPESDRSREK